jgi:hypothetical protein
MGGGPRRPQTGISTAHPLCGPLLSRFETGSGERRRPDPKNRPGYLRVDTVHQGDDLDGSQGVFHINAVGEVTQWSCSRLILHETNHRRRGVPNH